MFFQVLNGSNLKEIGVCALLINTSANLKIQVVHLCILKNKFLRMRLKEEK